MGKRGIQILAVLGFALLLAGCAKVQDTPEKLRDLKFHVLSEEEIPEEVRAGIEEKKQEPFKMTFQDEESLYICVGYGRQETSGFSIAVNELYETRNSIYVHTTLMGRSPGEDGGKAPSCPCIVIQLEKSDKKVVFD